MSDKGVRSKLWPFVKNLHSLILSSYQTFPVDLQIFNKTHSQKHLLFNAGQQMSCQPSFLNRFSAGQCEPFIKSYDR